MSKKAIETLLQEERVFYPPESFRSSAHVQSRQEWCNRGVNRERRICY